MLKTLRILVPAAIIFCVAFLFYKVYHPQILPDYSLDIEHLEETVTAIKANAANNIGASNQISDTVALFTTSLQSSISISASTMTLASASYNGGASTLASSTYGFIIDEGTATEELVAADCTGTACTNMTRGLDRLTGTTTVSSLAFAHRRGASVKITNAPSFLVVNRIIQGVDSFPNILRYASNPTFTIDKQLVTKKYVDDTAFSGAGVIDATASARGVVELSTGTEAASSTATGSSGTLALPGSLATSTYGQTSGLKVVVTENDGTLDPNFLRSKYGASTDTTDSYTFNLIPALYSYTAGTFVSFKPTATSTDIATLNVNGLGAKYITKGAAGGQLASGDILANTVVQTVYDGTNFQLINPPLAGMVLLASTSAPSSAVSNLDLTNIPPREFYKVIVYLEGWNTAADQVSILFNSDAGANYAVRHSEDGAADGTGSGANSLILTAATYQGAHYIDLGINNSASSTRAVDFRETISSPTGVPHRSEGAGTWNNTTKVNRITIQGNNAVAIKAGSRAYVFGTQY